MLPLNTVPTGNFQKGTEPLHVIPVGVKKQTKPEPKIENEKSETVITPAVAVDSVESAQG